MLELNKKLNDCFCYCVSQCQLNWAISCLKSRPMMWLKNDTVQAFYLTLRNIEFCGVYFCLFLLLFSFCPVFVCFAFISLKYVLIHHKKALKLWNRACLFQVAAIKKISLTSADCGQNRIVKSNQKVIFFLLATKFECFLNRWIC